MSGANLLILAQIHDELSCRQLEFPSIRNDFSSNLWRVSYCVDNVTFTDRWKDRRRQRHYPFSMKGQGVKIIWKNLCPIPKNKSYITIDRTVKGKLMVPVLRIRGRQMRPITQSADPTWIPMGDPTLEKWEHDETEMGKTFGPFSASEDW